MRFSPLNIPWSPYPHPGYKDLYHFSSLCLVLRWDFWNDVLLLFPLFEHLMLCLCPHLWKCASLFGTQNWTGSALFLIRCNLWLLGTSLRPYASVFLTWLFWKLPFLSPSQCSVAGARCVPFIHMPQIWASYVFSVTNLGTVHTMLLQSKVRQEFHVCSNPILVPGKSNQNVLSSLVLLKTTGKPSNY